MQIALFDIITNVWSTGWVLKDWKDALVVAITKKNGTALIAQTTGASPPLYRQWPWKELLDITLPDMLRERLAEP